MWKEAKVCANERSRAMQVALGCGCRLTRFTITLMERVMERVGNGVYHLQNVATHLEDVQMGTK